MSGLSVEATRILVGQHVIVSNAGFRAPAGGITGLIGPNGAGKSTLLRALAGIQPVATGLIRLGELDLAAMSRRQRARHCAYVDQSSATEERVTVRDVVALGRIPFQSAWTGVLGAEDLMIVREALVRLDMNRFADRQFSTLSGGEQQRVHVARAMAQEPKLLLLDEPTSHLDIRAQLVVLDVLRRLASEGCTVVIAMHDLNLALTHCDHLVVMSAGSVVAEGVPAEVLSPKLIRQVYGVETRLVSAEVAGRPIIVYEGAVPNPH